MAYIVMLPFVLMVTVMADIRTDYNRFGILRKDNRYMSSANKRRISFNRGLPFSKSPFRLAHGENFEMAGNSRDEVLPIQQSSYNIGPDGALSSLSKDMSDAMSRDENNISPYHRARTYQDDVRWESHNPGATNWISHSPTGGAVNIVEKGDEYGKKFKEANVDDESINQLLKSFQLEDEAGNIYHHWQHDNILGRNKARTVLQN